MKSVFVKILEDLNNITGGTSITFDRCLLCKPPEWETAPSLMRSSIEKLQNLFLCQTYTKILHSKCINTCRAKTKSRHAYQIYLQMAFLCLWTVKANPHIININEIYNRYYITDFPLFLTKELLPNKHMMISSLKRLMVTVKAHNLSSIYMTHCFHGFCLLFKYASRTCL